MAIGPYRPLSYPGHLTYFLAYRVVCLLPKNLPRYYSPWQIVQCGQFGKVQTIPHSHLHAVGEEDLQIISLPQDPPTVPSQNCQPNPVPYFLSLPLLDPDGLQPVLSWWAKVNLVPCQDHCLLQEGIELSSSPRLHGIGAG